MQSPQKLQARLDELLGPPGPDTDPLELLLRTVVQTTAPMVQGVIAQYTDEQLDAGLEGVALFFLGIRSDSAELTSDFLGELAKMNAAAFQAAHTLEATSTEDPSAPAAGSPAPAGGAPSPAAPVGELGATVGDVPTPNPAVGDVPPDPTPASPPETSPSSSSAPDSSSSDSSPAPSPAPSSGTGSGSTGSLAAGSNPAPPWGG